MNQRSSDTFSAKLLHYLIPFFLGIIGTIFGAGVVLGTIRDQISSIRETMNERKVECDQIILESRKVHESLRETDDKLNDRVTRLETLLPRIDANVAKLLEYEKLRGQ